MFPIKNSDKLIFVNIKNSYEAMMKNDKNHELFRENLYECTRKYWRIADEKAYNATQILGCYKGKVVEVIQIDKVSKVQNGILMGRKIFEGKEIPDSIYMNLDLHDIFATLANFNVKYWNL